MKLRRAPILASLLVAVSAPLLAANPYAYRMVLTPEEGPLDPKVERRYTPQYRACQDAAQTTIDISDCFVDEFDRQDAALNAAWKAAFPRQSKANQPLLRAAQRKWVAERDPFCRKQSDAYAGGTMAAGVFISCKVELTIRRTIWLEQLAVAPR